MPRIKVLVEDSQNIAPQDPSAAPPDLGMPAALRNVGPWIAHFQPPSRGHPRSRATAPWRDNAKYMQPGGKQNYKKQAMASLGASLGAAGTVYGFPQVVGALALHRNFWQKRSAGAAVSVQPLFCHSTSRDSGGKPFSYTHLAAN